MDELSVRVDVLEEEVERLRQENVKLRKVLTELEKQVMDPGKMGEIYEAARMAGRLGL
jgi:regulator of replication initiation timing